MRARSNYPYKLRPGYGSNELLIEFGVIREPDKLIDELIIILKRNHFEFISKEDIWVNDEIWFNFKSENGRITLSRNIWDLIFIHGEENQIDIDRIDELLSKTNGFSKEPVDFSEYK